MDLIKIINNRLETFSFLRVIALKLLQLVPIVKETKTEFNHAYKKAFGLSNFENGYEYSVYIIY
jgi:hypothetical protein